MGHLSNAVGDDSVAIGHQAQTTQAYSIAIGKQAKQFRPLFHRYWFLSPAAGQNSFAGGNNAKRLEAIQLLWVGARRLRSVVSCIG